MGFKIEDDLNTDESRRLWLDWKRRIDPSHYLDPEKRAEAGHRAMMAMVAEGLIDRQHIHGTINCNGVNAKGEVCGVTTTSGLAWKIPGRVGDSPILGAGLYVDGEIGAAGSTGRGEANLFGLCSFLIVENMRRGMTAERRRHGRLQTDQGEHDREAPAQQPRRTEFQRELLRPEREGRIRGRGALSGKQLRGLHGGRAEDGGLGAVADRASRRIRSTRKRAHSEAGAPFARGRLVGVCPTVNLSRALLAVFSSSPERCTSFRRTLILRSCRPGFRGRCALIAISGAAEIAGGLGLLLAGDTARWLRSV